MAGEERQGNGREWKSQDERRMIFMGVERQQKIDSNSIKFNTHFLSAWSLKMFLSIQLNPLVEAWVALS